MKENSLHFTPHTKQLTKAEWSSLETFISNVIGDQIKYTKMFMVNLNSDTITFYQQFYKISKHDDKRKLKYFNQLKIFYFLKTLKLYSIKESMVFDGHPLNAESLLEKFSSDSFQEILNTFKEYQDNIVGLLHKIYFGSMEIETVNNCDPLKATEALKNFISIKGKSSVENSILNDIKELKNLKVINIFTLDSGASIIQLQDQSYKLYSGDAERSLKGCHNPSVYDSYYVECDAAKEIVEVLNEISSPYFSTGFHILLLNYYSEENIVTLITPLILESLYRHSEKIIKFSYCLRGLEELCYRFSGVKNDGAIINNAISREFAKYFLDNYSNVEESEKVIEFFKPFNERGQFINTQYTNIFNQDTFMNYFLYFTFRGSSRTTINFVVNIFMENLTSRNRELNWDEYVLLSNNLLKMILYRKEYDELIAGGSLMPIDWFLEMQELEPVD